MISPTPGLPRSPSRSEIGGGIQRLPLFRVAMGTKPSSSFFDFCGVWFAQVSCFFDSASSIFSTALSIAASSRGSRLFSSSFFATSFLIRAMISSFIDVSKITKIEIVMRAIRITALK